MRLKTEDLLSNLRWAVEGADKHATFLAELPPISPQTPGPEKWLQKAHIYQSQIKELQELLRRFVDDTGDWPTRLAEAYKALDAQIHRMLYLDDTGTREE